MRDRSCESLTVPSLLCSHGLHSAPGNGPGPAAAGSCCGLHPASDSMRAHVRGRAGLRGAVRRVQFAASNEVGKVDGPAQLGRKPAQLSPAVSAQDGAVFARTSAIPICLPRRLVTKSTSVWGRPGHPRGQPLDFRPPARTCTGQARLWSDSDYAHRVAAGLESLLLWHHATRKSLSSIFTSSTCLCLLGPLLILVALWAAFKTCHCLLLFVVLRAIIFGHK